MPDKSALENYYGTLTEQQLLQLRSEGGFTAEAERVLSIELAQRHLRSRDVSKHLAAAKRSNSVTKSSNAAEDIGALGSSSSVKGF